jgi:hypothetical protein
MIDTSIFRPQINTTYPPFNFQLFEEYFFKIYTEKNIVSERIYIPIFWTSLYVNRNYGQGDLSDVQDYLDNLDRNKKYFTIVQYDDNILNNLGELDILIFAMGGHGKYKENCYAIPLNCQEPPGLQLKNKDIFASFTGSPTHHIRNKIYSELSGNPKYILSSSIGYWHFRDVMSRSIFSLCPRGYGQTSFRICESLQVESIPVYIYDEPLIPFNDLLRFEEYGVLIHESNLSDIDSILSSISNSEIDRLVQNGREVYKSYYSYVGCFDKILLLIDEI